MCETPGAYILKYMAVAKSKRRRTYFFLYKEAR